MNKIENVKAIIFDMDGVLLDSETVCDRTWDFLLCHAPADCVAIEDSYNGVRSAVAAGIRTIMVPDKLASNDEMKKIATEICSNLKVVIENCL